MFRTLALELGIAPFTSATSATATAKLFSATPTPTKFTAAVLLIVTAATTAVPTGAAVATAVSRTFLIISFPSLGLLILRDALLSGCRRNVSRF